MYIRAGENPVCRPGNEQDELLLRVPREGAITSGLHAAEVNLDRL